jgi:hypothetical protein
MDRDSTLLKLFAKSTRLVVVGAAVLLAVIPAHAVLTVDATDPAFARLATQEIEAMRSGQRGLVCQSLIARIDRSSATTTVRPITSDESTWHPNDQKGTRSHVVALDTRVRGADRNRPTGATVFIHPSRVDPSLSLFKLGTFVFQLAVAADLNDGQFSADYRIREKRASFYRNAWLDAMGLKPLAVSDRVPTPEYAKAKAAGWLTADHVADFPILRPDGPPSPAPSPSPSALP